MLLNTGSFQTITAYLENEADAGLYWVLVGVSGLINTLFYLSHRIIQVNDSDEKQAIYFLKL